MRTPLRSTGARSGFATSSLPLTYGSILLATFCWGASYAMYKILATELGPLVANSVRFTVASLVIAVWFLVLRGLALPSLRDVPLLFLVGALGPGLSSSLMMFGLSYVSATESTLVINLNPVIVAILAAVFLGEHLTRRKLLGALVSFGGLCLVVLGGGVTIGEAQNRPLGIAILLVGSLAWSVYTLLVRVVMRRYPPFDATAYAFVAGTMILIPIAAPLAPFDRLAEMSATGWLALVFASTVGGALPFVLANRGVQAIGASRAAVFNSVIPLWTAAVAAVLLGERLTALQWLGAALVIGGVVLANTGRVVAISQPSVRPPGMTPS